MRVGIDRVASSGQFDARWPVAADRGRGSWRRGEWSEGSRTIATEAAVAMTYDGSTYAVMMASPEDLHDFAVGFSLAEGLISGPEDIRDVDVLPLADGIDLRIWLSPTSSAAHLANRRRLVGPTGCGLCGVESLAQAARPVAKVESHATFEASQVSAAMERLAQHQPLNLRTRSVHAAAFWSHRSGAWVVREDVGRHNALDKLAGAVAARRLDASAGAVLMTSRLSVELVQKTAAMGCPLLVAISAPTSLAIDTADAAGVTLVAVARDDRFEVFTHARRLTV